MKFYTNVQQMYNTVMYRGYQNGKRVKKIVDYKPTYYIPTQGPSNLKTLDGRRVEKKKFDDIIAAREFLKKYQANLSLLK